MCCAGKRLLLSYSFGVVKSSRRQGIKDCSPYMTLILYKETASLRHRVQTMERLLAGNFELVKLILRGKPSGFSISLSSDRLSDYFLAKIKSLPIVLHPA